MRPFVALSVSLLVLASTAICADASARSPGTGGTGNGKGSRPAPSPFDGDGMWIWIVSKASGGSPAAIAAKAKASGIETVFVKSGDAGNYWGQFNPTFVNALKQRGLKVCAWHYVYGSRPSAEAAVSARAAKNGADCFVIDAEAEYEGRYAAARTYMRKLRASVGADYPIGLAAFPYVDYHPSFPYSVFLGPGGAQFNLPQMYWRAIGVSVTTVFSHTYLYNLVYKRPIYPLGQVYMAPSGSELSRFRALAAVNGATGVSWWDWKSAGASQWRALARPAPSNQSLKATTGYPKLFKGSRGDLVVWAQTHLVAAGYDAPATGYFRAKTAQAVSAFRSDRGLGTGSVIDNATWTALLKFTPKPAWKQARAAATGTTPDSASLPAIDYEIAQ